MVIGYWGMFGLGVVAGMVLLTVIAIIVTKGGTK